MLIVILPVLAFLIGIVASMTGVGGGVFMVPILTLIFGFEPAHASGTSLAAIVFTSISSTLSYARQRRIDYLVGGILVGTTVPGAFLGSYATSLISKQALGLAFSFFLVFVALRMLLEVAVFRKWRTGNHGWSRRIVDSEGVVFSYKTNLWFTPVFGFLGGFFSGLLGIGGGALLVPAMHLAMNVPIHLAVATSMFTMIFTSLSGSLTHLWLGNVHLEYSALLAVGVVFGAQIGAQTARRVSKRGLRRVFAVVLLIVGLRMMLKYGGFVP